ncbi:MAG TPA: DUF6657 family protein [Treponemataceae bacterium]|nr:DUF6657 family protein [Treponemataceae bacterium]
MAEIRSALDIALERTADIVGDKTVADARDMKNKGKKLASEFVTSGKLDDLSKELSTVSAEHRAFIAEGAISVLLAGLHLPTSAEDIVQLEKTGAALDVLVPETGMVDLFFKISQIFTQYVEEKANLLQALEQQFTQKLKAKQQEMEARYGQSVPINLYQDSEYIAERNKNTRMLDEKFEAVIFEVRFRVREAAGIEE